MFAGHLAAQVLFDGYLDEIQSGEYVLGVNTTAPHGTVISRKFKFFTLIFVVNTSGSLHADIRGKRNGTNVTVRACAYAGNAYDLFLYVLQSMYNEECVCTWVAELTIAKGICASQYFNGLNHSHCSGKRN